MADPQVMLSTAIARAIERTLGIADADPLVRPATNARFGDYQANFAMPLGKQVGRPPHEIADAVVGQLDLTAVCEQVEVAGPGFVNLALDRGWLAANVGLLLDDPLLGVTPAFPAQRVVVDYSAPNIAKEMHVGHLRSTIIGDALCRVLDALGHTVIRQNHLGDWGTPFGMLIEHLVDLGEAEGAKELSVGDLTSFYQAARTAFDSDPSFARRARARVVLLQGGDEPTLRLWRILVDASKRYFNLVYERLGVLLTDDDLVGESFYNPMLPSVASELEDKGIAVIDHDALCVFPPGFKGREGDPLPLIVRKSDGGFGYAATDLAAVRYRALDLDAQRIIYAVDSGQSQHLAMVFSAAGLAGWLEHTKPEHVAFGIVLGSDGQRLKTRSGESPKLIDLLDEAVERAGAVVRERDLDASGTARAIGIGAVKYADLSNDRIKDYTFDWDRMLAFEGNTAAYLQYAYVRVRSIFRRGSVAPVGPRDVGAVLIETPEERGLALALLRFDAAVNAVAETLEPHKLCTYLFELAQAYTAFFEACPVLRAETPELVRSRVVLCELTARVLAMGLGMLGIDVVEQM